MLDLESIIQIHGANFSIHIIQRVNQEMEKRKEEQKIIILTIIWPQHCVSLV